MDWWAASGRLGYRLVYRFRLAFWDTFDTDRALVGLVQGPGALRAGRALDLGCGTGRNAVYLARHGWEVTGVDLVERAIARARRRAADHKVQVRFVHGDVTRLDELGIGDGFTLLVDFGCFHTVPIAQRDAYAAAVTKVAAPQATLWMWGLGIRPQVGIGVTAEEVRTRFPGWHLDLAERVPGPELRDITQNLPLIERPVRAAMTTRWFPGAYRFQLTRRSPADVNGDQV